MIFVVLCSMKQLDIVFIDGVAGCGKTSQIVLLRNYLKRRNISTKIFNFENIEKPTEIYDMLCMLDKYKQENKDSCALCDGSIAKNIIYDMADNMYGRKFYNKHKENLQKYEYINQTYNISNILINLENIDICEERLSKKQKMQNKEFSGLDSQQKEKLAVVSKGFKNFNNHSLNYNITFNNINTEGHETMLDIHHDIINIIQNNYIIKKPS